MNAQVLGRRAVVRPGVPGVQALWVTSPMCHCQVRRISRTELGPLGDLRPHGSAQVGPDLPVAARTSASLGTVASGGSPPIKLTAL